MKPTKALKRIAHAEELISDVLERYSDVAPEIRKQLLDAKAAVVRAKDAVKSQVPARKTSGRNKAGAKKAVVKVPRAKPRKKYGPTKQDSEG
jgi:hypothetical protein